MNLISVKEDSEIVLKHFVDALTPVPFLPHKRLAILDIGTGPGLPGIPMKIAVDDWHLHLLESSRKRTSFLKETIRKLDLQNASVIHDRVENIIQRHEYEKSFDAVISRATLKLPQLIEFSNYFLNKGGRLVAMKGIMPDEEWAAARQVSDNTGLLYYESHDVFIPSINSPRKIIIYINSN